MRARDSSFFFRLWKKKPNNQKPVFETAKERKSEREREREEKSNREESLASLTTLSPLFVSAVVLKINKAL